MRLKLRTSTDALDLLIDTKCGVSTLSYRVWIGPVGKKKKKAQVVLSREIPDDDNILEAFIWLIWAEWSPLRTELGATPIIKV